MKDGTFRPRNLDDFWDARKAYDARISDVVKKANSQSAPSTQLQKQMWLENRKIFNDAIDELSQGLEKSAKAQFDEMSKLYNARQNIISNVKVDLTGQPGLIRPRNIIGGLITTGLAGLGIKMFND